MSADSNRLLDHIEEGVVAHGGDLGGATRRLDDALSLFDGRVSLRAEVSEAETSAGDETVHTHVFATLHEYDDEILDACVFGFGEDRAAAIAEAAVIWITCVAGPIRSFLDDRPVCMTTRAGVAGGNASDGYLEGDYGLPGLRAYVGPSVARGFGDQRARHRLDETKPWFRFASESAAPRRVHLAKACLLARGDAGWERELEIDGHDLSYRDPDWPAGFRGPDSGYLMRFAVFEFPRDSPDLRRRAELERTIRYFAEGYPKYDSIDRLMSDMVEIGFDPDLVHETESISTIAFGRTLFEAYGVKYAPTVIRARRDGRIEPDVELMTIPAYARARALAVKLRETMPGDDFRSLCFYNAESNAILKAIDAHGDKLDLTQIQMFPCVVPDRDVSDETMDAAIAMLKSRAERDREPEPEKKKKKPWWRF